MTTNIIFGITDHSQCMKCKKIQPIPIDMVIEVDVEIDIEIDMPKIISDVDEFLISKKSDYGLYYQLNSPNFSYRTFKKMLYKNIH